MITHGTEIDRPPEEVFAYLDQPERHGEWQTEIVSASVETPGWRVSIEFDLEGHGFGKLIAPFARSQARKSIVAAQDRLKAKLEAGV